MSAIDLDSFGAASLRHDPYDHVIVPEFLKADAIAPIDADYPSLEKPGSFALDGLEFGPAFAALIGELQGTGMRHAVAGKFGVDLDLRPSMITVRGHCRARDGRLHTDTESKIITVLIYMKSGWEAEGGRLRVLRSGDDMDDFAAEVPPDSGTLLAFRRSAKSWHGHPTFVGARRVIQLNWVTDEAVVRREQERHKLSAWLKKLMPVG